MRSLLSSGKEDLPKGVFLSKLLEMLKNKVIGKGGCGEIFEKTHDPQLKELLEKAKELLKEGSELKAKLSAK